MADLRLPLPTFAAARGRRGPASVPGIRAACGRPVTRAGLIVNPLSGKASGRGLALAGMLATSPSVSVRIIDDFRRISAILAEFGREGVSDLFISSGDGTIHEILTRLIEDCPMPALPRLALLPHGTTNMTAADLGFRHGSLADQAGFIADPRPKVMRERPTIRCANPADGQPRHGMFVGAGAVAEATRYCQEALNARGVRGNWATFATLAGGVGRTLLTRADPADPARFDRPFDIAVEADGRFLARGPQLLHMSTTLEKLVLGANPFWGERCGAIRTSVFPYPVPSVLRWLLPVMYGGDRRTGPPGAVSFTSDALQVGWRGRFVIDGEFFEGPADAMLRLETGPRLTFLCG